MIIEIIAFRNETPKRRVKLFSREPHVREEKSHFTRLHSENRIGRLWQTNKNPQARRNWQRQSERPPGGRAQSLRPDPLFPSSQRETRDRAWASIIIQPPLPWSAYSRHYPGVQRIFNRKEPLLAKPWGLAIRQSLEDFHTSFDGFAGHSRRSRRFTHMLYCTGKAPALHPATNT